MESMKSLCTTIPTQGQNQASKQYRPTANAQEELCILLKNACSGKNTGSHEFIDNRVRHFLRNVPSMSREKIIGEVATLFYQLKCSEVFDDDKTLFPNGKEPPFQFQNLLPLLLASSENDTKNIFHPEAAFNFCQIIEKANPEKYEAAKEIIDSIVDGWLRANQNESREEILMGAINLYSQIDSSTRIDSEKIMLSNDNQFEIRQVMKLFEQA